MIKRSFAALIALLFGAVLMAPNAAAAAETCGNVYRGSAVIARACMTTEYQGANVWHYGPVKVWNPPGGATTAPVYALYKYPSGSSDYSGAIGDGKTDIQNVFGAANFNNITMKFEIDTAAWAPNCVYMVPGSVTVTGGTC